MKALSILVLFLFTFTNNEIISQNHNDNRIVYEANEKGEKISGDLTQLIEYINKGYLLRVGWEIRGIDLENKQTTIKHWANASFITIYKNQVFAQLSSIFEQGISMGKEPSVFLAKGKADGWVAIISTNGELKQKFNNSHMSKLPKEVLKEMENMTVKTTWIVLKN